MYVDSQNEFSDAQAVTATAISENVIDLTPDDQSNTTIDIGTGEEIYLVVQTQTAATDAGSDATLTVTLESDAQADLAGSPTVHYTTGALAFATFSPAGAVIAKVRLPAGDYQRYLGLRYTVAAGPLTAGNFDAFLTKDAEAVKNYASGFTIS